MIARVLVLTFGGIWRLKRLCQTTHAPLLKKLYILVYQLYQFGNGSGVAWNSTFAGEPCLPHGMAGIFISGGAKIGRNCVIFQQVTIGSNTLADSQGIGAPEIGDNCYIAAGAKVIGNVKVGNNTRIGANTVVYKDVPDNSIVVSGKQRTITRDAPVDNRFYSYRERWEYFADGNWLPASDTEALDRLEGRKRP